MDPFGSIALAFAVLNLGVVFGRSLQSTGPLDYDRWRKCVRLGKDKQFYGVWDIPLAGGGDFHSCTDNNFVWGASEAPPVLPPQDADSIRLSVREAAKDGTASDSETTSGFTALSLQWRKDPLQPWYQIKTYETKHTARVSRYIRVFKDQNQRRHVELECQTFVIPPVSERLDRKPPARQFFTTAMMSLELQALDCDYRHIRADENWKQAFLLQFHHACLRLFANFLANLVLQDRRGRDDDIDPAWAELRRWNLKEITKHSYEARNLREMGQELVTTAESLIDVVKASVTVSGAAEKMTKFMAIETELRGSCREMRERLQKLSDVLDHDLKFLELARNVNQTRGVQQLTLLATIFLPLSLAAGVLSMQTRFKDLGSLLYDFFGVVVLLGAIVVIIFLIMTVMAIVKEAESRLAQYFFYRKHVRRIVLLLVILGLFLYGSLVLSSFLVGMFKDVPLGAKILGYGSAAALGVMLIFLLPPTSFGFYLWISSTRFKKRETKRRSVEDPEGTAADDTQQGVRVVTREETLEDMARV